MLLNGKELSLKMRESLIEKVAKLEKKPGLVVIQVGDDKASSIYVNSKEKLAREIGYNFEHIKLPTTITEEEMIEIIEKINKDNNINGVIVQLPIPKNLDATKIINHIDPIKDIDGLTKANVGKLFTDKAELISCTPKGIMTLLKNYNVEFEGKHVVIVGRSNLVGKPLISLCLNENATVTICHSKTKNLEKFTKEADILIVAIGKKKFITKDMVKENAVVVDVGINRDNDSKKIFGDVKFDEVEPIASLITPVPGGVGPMTTITLMENVLVSYNLMNNKS